MGNTKITKPFLNLFAKSVRDANSEEEVKQLVETTKIAIDEVEQEKIEKTTDGDPMTKIVDAINSLTDKIDGLCSQLNNTPSTSGSEVSTGDGNADNTSNASNTGDTSMEKLNEVENSLDDEDCDTKDCDYMKDGERSIEEVVESSRDNTTDADTSEGIAPKESNTLSKIVKDVKPYLAKISNEKERKCVCDALAKSIGDIKQNGNEYAEIMQVTTNRKNVTDSYYESTEKLQEYYDSCNPHKKNK